MNISLMAILSFGFLCLIIFIISFLFASILIKKHDEKVQKYFEDKLKKENEKYK